jgi:hypothetical protein
MSVDDALGLMTERRFFSDGPDRTRSRLRFYGDLKPGHFYSVLVQRALLPNGLVAPGGGAPALE